MKFTIGGGGGGGKGMISAMMRISFKIKLKNSKVGKTYNEWYPSKEEIEY